MDHEISDWRGGPVLILAEWRKAPSLLELGTDIVPTLEDNGMLLILGELSTKVHEQDGQTDSSLLTALEARKVERWQSRFLWMPAQASASHLTLAVVASVVF